MRLLLVLCLLLPIGFVNPASAAKQISWEDLKDPFAGNFDDPFASLTITQLRSLATVIRLRKLLAEPDVDRIKRGRIEEQLDREEAKLAVSGVDTEALLSRRLEIGRKRAAAALAGNQALNGAKIVITGYVIPVHSPGSETADTGYLVPEAGMCSHMPVPDANQMIRYRLSMDWRADYVYEPVVLIGELSLATTRQEITLLDGEVEMISSFEMDVIEARPLHDPDRAARERSFLNFPGHAQSAPRPLR